MREKQVSKKKGNAVSLKNTVLYFRYLAGLNSQNLPHRGPKDPSSYIEFGDYASNVWMKSVNMIYPEWNCGLLDCSFKFCIRENVSNKCHDMSCVLRISVITIWTVETWMKTPALLCLRFQALAEALKTNASVTDIDLSGNPIGDEGAKAWCVGWAPQNRWMLRHVMMSLSHTFPASCDSDKFGWFGGAGVSSFIFHRKESCQICRCCKQLSLSFAFCIVC